MQTTAAHREAEQLSKMQITDHGAKKTIKNPIVWMDLEMTGVVIHTILGRAMVRLLLQYFHNLVEALFAAAQQVNVRFGASKTYGKMARGSPFLGRACEDCRPQP